MPCEVDIAYLLNTVCEDKMRNNDRDYSHFHPSEWDRCHRQKAYAYYESKGLIKVDAKEIKVDGKLQRIFDVGHYAHERLGKYLEQTGALRGCWKCANFSAHKEPKIYGIDQKHGCFRPEICECGSTRFKYVEIGYYDEETMWGGHVDAILDLGVISAKFKGMPKQTEYIIVDYKSINSRNFGELKQPKPEHITQMQIYLYLSGLKNGKFIYENKDNQNIKEFLVERDDILLEAKVAEAKLLKHRVTTVNSQGKRVLPPRGHASKLSDACKSCKYRKKCWEGVADPPSGSEYP